MATVCPCIASKAPAHLGWAAGRGEETIPLGLARFFIARLSESLVTFWTQTPVTHTAYKPGWNALWKARHCLSKLSACITPSLCSSDLAACESQSPIRESVRTRASHNVQACAVEALARLMPLIVHAQTPGAGGSVNTLSCRGVQGACQAGGGRSAVVSSSLSINVRL